MWRRGPTSIALFIGPCLLLAQSETLTTPAVSQVSVCIAAVNPPTPGMKSLANPAGGNQVKVYTIKFDDLASLRALPDRGVEVPPLSVVDKHLVRVFGDGARVASFYFLFSDYTTNELCLTFNDFYEMRNLLDCGNARAWRGMPEKAERRPR